MRDLNQLIIKFNYEKNFTDDDFMYLKVIRIFLIFR